MAMERVTGTEEASPEVKERMVLGESLRQSLDARSPLQDMTDEQLGQVEKLKGALAATMNVTPDDIERALENLAVTTKERARIPRYVTRVRFVVEGETVDAPPDWPEDMRGRLNEELKLRFGGVLKVEGMTQERLER